MKIGHGENYLTIKRRDETDPYSGFSIFVSCGDDGATFTGANEVVHFDRNETASKSFEDFAALKRNQTRIDLTEDCYLELIRQSRGDIQIKFQIHRHLFDATLTGQILVHAEYSTTLLCELGELAFGILDDPTQA